MSKPPEPVFQDFNIKRTIVTAPERKLPDLKITNMLLSMGGSNPQEKTMIEHRMTDYPQL